MTAKTTPASNAQRLTGADLKRTKFTLARKYERGYDEAEVDTFVSRCADELEVLRGRIRALEEENKRLRERGGGADQDDVLRSVKVLIQAQRTADTTVAQADEYSARVMTEARALYENARHKAAEMVDEAHDKAKKAAAEKGEVEREATYLRTLRDVTRTQIETFLEGILNHVAAEYGRATTEASQAAATLDEARDRSSMTALQPPGSSAR